MFQTVLSAQKDNLMYIYSLQTFEKIFEMKVNNSHVHQGLAYPISWTACQTHAILWSQNCLYALHGELRKEEIEPFSNPLVTAKILGFAVSNEKCGKSFVASCHLAPDGNRTGKVEVFELSSKKLVKEYLISKIDDVKFSWNQNEPILLMCAATDVDTTGKSYYGNSSLYYMLADESEPRLIVQYAEGPVHDFQWSPRGSEFLVIFGQIPPKIIIYDALSGQAKFSLGETRKNHIAYNPFGRLILLGGFGNLAGDVDIWDRNSKKIIASTQAACTVQCQWSPNGRLFLSTTSTPRVRVDNCVKVFLYNGDLLTNLSYDEVYTASWRPVQANKYVDRPPSPQRLKKKEELTNKDAIYMAKGMSAFLTSDRTRQMNMKAISNTAPKEQSIPGLTISKSAKRNAARRLKAKNAKETV